MIRGRFKGEGSTFLWRGGKGLAWLDTVLSGGIIREEEE